MAKYGLVGCALLGVILLVAGLLSTLGNPINGGTWSFHSKEWLLYVDSSQQPMALEKHTSKRAGMVKFGHISYVWNRH